MKLSPDNFWDLRLAEWRWLLSAGAPSSDRLTTREFQTLAAQYPDEKP